MARAHACFVLEVCDGVVNSVPAAAATANSVPWGRRGGGGASYLDAMASPQRVLLTQGGAPGQNERQLTLLILRILSGKRNPPSPKHFIIRELETVLPTAIP